MAKQRLLVIDDDADICTLLQRFLTKQGYEVDTAQRGASAKELLKDTHYDLVLCDHRLPDTDSVVRSLAARCAGAVAATGPDAAAGRGAAGEAPKRALPDSRHR